MDRVQNLRPRKLEQQSERTGKSKGAALTEERGDDEPEGPDAPADSVSAPPALERVDSSVLTDSQAPFVSRPDLYPHAPQARSSILDAVPDIRNEEVLLDALQTHNLEGLYNLSFLVLMSALLYMTMRSVRSYGFRAPLSHILCVELWEDVLAHVGVIAFLFLFSVPLYGVCIAHFRYRYFSESVFGALAFGYNAALFSGATCIVWAFIRVPPVSLVSACCILVHCMKLHSYVRTNVFLRKTRRERRRAHHASKGSSSAKSDVDSARESDSSASTSAPESSPSAFPKNLTLKNFFFFVACAPTLVYETEYPRTDRIRKRVIMKCLLQILLCSVLQYFIMFQFILPILSSPIDSVADAVFSIVQLSIPSMILWLLSFYAFFQCYLNILAEFSHFADRHFFSDWWNASTLDSFWRKWNIPVHEWCLRHVYLETMQAGGTSKHVATFWVFFISAILHEYLFSVSFKFVRPWFFIAMVLQVPMILASRRYRGRRRGNLMMWLNLFVGQPLLNIMYSREWFSTHNSLFCLS